MSGLFKILIVDDDTAYRETYQMLLSRKGYVIEVAASAEEALQILDNEYYPLVITDMMMPGMDGITFLKQVRQAYHKSIEVIMVTGYGSIETAVKTMKIGAFGYFIKSHHPEELILEIEKVRKLVELSNVNELNQNYQDQKYLLSSKNREMQDVLKLVDQVADSNANILITGESGVGKEIIAKQIHQKSGRAQMPFIPINCQYYSHHLIESELFGHEKGAFTGAVAKRIGRLEEASGGTVFLDEIGDMELATQVKLLRVLETKQIERIGSNKIIDVDFRLVSATNRDLYKIVNRGNFREDLLYRINTIEIKVPPLRKRREDLEDMILFFMNRFNREMSKEVTSIDEGTKEYLLRYDYPGNVREMKNIIERLVVLSTDGILRWESKGVTTMDREAKLEEQTLPLKEARQQFEQAYIIRGLKQCDNNITRAAAKMGISRRQLFNKITEYNLKEYIERDLG